MSGDGDAPRPPAAPPSLRLVSGGGRTAAAAPSEWRSPEQISALESHERLQAVMKDIENRIVATMREYIEQRVEREKTLPPRHVPPTTPEERTKYLRYCAVQDAELARRRRRSRSR